MYCYNNLIESFHGFQKGQISFKCENIFTDSEVNLFSQEDKLSIWEPYGIPFSGEFDFYIKVYKNKEFKGFFRIEVFPWGEFNLHIAFPKSHSLISRFYLQTTRSFLCKLIPYSKKIPIYCIFKIENKNVLRYMQHFDFEEVKSKNGLLIYRFNMN